MNPILFEKAEESFLTNGFGRLTDAIDCRVTEERNGLYELEMTYPATGIHFDSIQNERILYARHSDGLDCQPFRIYKVTKPLNGKVKVYARHISYDLSKMTVMPCDAETCAEALEAINANTISGGGFVFWTDKTTRANFLVKVPSSVRSVLGGKEGSVLDTFGGGEYEFDHWTVKLHMNRGADSGVTIRYGKNLCDFTQELNADGIITGVAPFWQSAAEDGGVVTLPEGAVIAASSASGVLTEYYWDENTQIYRDENGVGYETGTDAIGVVPLDLSSQFDSEPTVDQLRAAAVAYLRANAAKLVETENIKVSFVQLWQTEEYANVAPLQRLRLCDTVSIYYPQYEVNATAKVIKTVYNVLLERYDSMELGDARSSLAKTITGQNLKIESVKTEAERKTTSMMEAAINHATQMIQGGLGGHVVMNPNANGQPEEILIMDTDDTSTAVNVIRMNKNGIAFSQTGYNGVYRTGWTIEGNFVADFITTGTLNANLIKAGTMSADRILGGTMKLGGTNNTNGVLEIYNSSNTRVGRWDNNTLYLGNIAGIGASGLTNPNTKIDVNGAITTKSLTANDYIYVDGNTTSKLKIPYLEDKNRYLEVGANGFKAYSDEFGFVDIAPRTINSALATSITGLPVLYAKATRYSGKELEIWSAAIKMKRDSYNVDLNPYGIWFRQTGSSGYWKFYVGRGENDSSWGLAMYGTTTIEPGPLLVRNSSNRTVFSASTGRVQVGESGYTRSMYVYGNLYTYGNLTCTGTKPRLVTTEDYGQRYLYCYETPSPLFGDVGEGTIGEDGKCYVQIDSIFAETVSLNQYQVFLQKYGDGDCWIAERKGAYFVVGGTAGLKFGWEIKAKQGDFTQLRLEKETGDIAYPKEGEDANYANDLLEHISQIKTLREVTAA